jgi:hypothetical protein
MIWTQQDEVELRMQQLLDMIIDQAVSRLGLEKSQGDPIIKMLYDVKEGLRESVNHRLACEMNLNQQAIKNCLECGDQAHCSHAEVIQ